MERLEKLFTEKFYFYYLASVMLLIPVGELITEFFSAPFITQPIILTAYGIAGILIIILSMLNNRLKNQAFYPSDIFCILLIFFAFISLIFSKDFEHSYMGFYYDELPAHFLAYFAFMFAGTMISDNELRKKILYIFIIVATLQGIVAFFQTFGLRIEDAYYDPEWHARDNLAYGLTQHNNWFAGLSTIFVAACGGLFIFTDKKKKIAYLYFALTALSIYVSFSTGARIAWVGNAAVVLFYIISFIIMKQKKYDGALLRSCVKSLLIIIAVYAVILGALILLSNTFENAIEDIAREQAGSFEDMGSYRIYIWKYGLESVPHNWLTGVGLDNYYYVFTSNPNWSEDMFSQGKGHNEYIHTLVTQGVFAALNYIIFLIYAASTAVKDVIDTEDEHRRRITWIFLGMFCGYAAQAFFNSSVINIAMYFWIVLGMSMPKSTQKPLNLKRKSKA